MRPRAQIPLCLKSRPTAHAEAKVRSSTTTSVTSSSPLSATITSSGTSRLITKSSRNRDAALRLFVTLLPLALVACRASAADRSSSDRTCDSSCLAAAVVEVLAGRTASGATATCAGSVVGSSADGAWILTAAHCASSTHGPLWVRAPGRSEPLPVTRTAIDARFQPTLVSSLHDFGLLLVPGLRGASPVSVIRDRPRASTADGWRLAHREGQQLRVLDVTTRAVRSLTAVIQGQASICHGQSGTPVLGRDGGSWTIVGVISKGPRECAPSATIGLMSRSDLRMLVDRLAGSPAHPVAPTCSECLEELAAEIGPCSTATSRCERDRACSEQLDALRAGGAVAMVAASPSSLFGAVYRCLCYTSCRASCDALCAGAKAP